MKETTKKFIQYQIEGLQRDIENYNLQIKMKEESLFKVKADKIKAQEQLAELKFDLKEGSK
jgi:peptidoglycan hydrolase CwlO-like protein